MELPQFYKQIYVEYLNALLYIIRAFKLNALC